jgi:hypothetical protein
MFEPGQRRTGNGCRPAISPRPHPSCTFQLLNPSCTPLNRRGRLSGFVLSLPYACRGHRAHRTLICILYSLLRCQHRCGWLTLHRGASSVSWLACTARTTGSDCGGIAAIATSHEWGAPAPIVINDFCPAETSHSCPRRFSAFTSTDFLLSKNVNVWGRRRRQ